MSAPRSLFGGRGAPGKLWMEGWGWGLPHQSHTPRWGHSGRRRGGEGLIGLFLSPSRRVSLFFSGGGGEGAAGGAEHPFS